MNFKFLAPFSLIGLIISINAQPSPKPDEKAVAAKIEKQKQLADQALADVPGLKLGENRSYVLARVGTLLCKERKTAQAIFHRSVNELLNAQMLAETEEKAKVTQNAGRIIQAVRPEVLNLIGSCDAELALESLYRTRTPSIQRALVQPVENSAKISEIGGSSASLAQSEFNLEQRLLSLAAMQNPERAAKLLQDTIKKGLSSETHSLLKKLYEKDPETAQSLASETMDKLLSASFSTDPADQGPISLSFTILYDHIRPRKPGAKDLRFEDMQMRSLASKLISHTLGQSPTYLRGRIPSLIKIAEALSPGSLAALKKFEKSSMPPGASNMIPNSDARNLMDPAMTPAQMLAGAKKIPSESRGPVYQSAANKMAQAGDMNAALELLNANFSGRALENAISSLNWYYAAHLMNQGKWVEAERLIDEFPESNRRSALIMLATRAFAKDPVENKAYAVAVLQKTRASLSEKPSDQTELTQFIQLATAFAGIEPAEAFNTFDSVIPILNELTDATAIVQGFQNSMAVVSGEFVMVRNGSYGFHFDQNVLRVLAKADFERTLKVIDAFTRREMRIGLRLQVAENGLN